MPRNPSPEVSVTTFSLRTELKAPLNQAIQATGLKYVSELLAAIASSPDRAAAALKPVVDEFLASRKVIRQHSAAEMKKKLAGLSAEQLRELVERIEADKAAKEKATP